MVCVWILLCGFILWVYCSVMFVWLLFLGGIICCVFGGCVGLFDCGVGFVCCCVYLVGGIGDGVIFGGFVVW